ncbi:MAG: hypothetical protein ACXVZ1_10455 [Gaiellaceae bacterium]
MKLTLRDAAATVVTGLIVLTFAATHEGWGVPLVGDSRRWAAGAILLLGMVACSIDGAAVTARFEPGGRGVGTAVLATLGAASLALAVVAIATGSLTVLSLLVAVVLVLWAASTTGHVLGTPPRQAAA